MCEIASQITSASCVYSTVCSGADQIIYQSSSSLAFVRGIHRWQVNFPHKEPVTRKMFPFDDVNMCEDWRQPLRNYPYLTSRGIKPIKKKWPLFAENLSKCILLNENVFVLSKISLNLIPKENQTFYIWLVCYMPSANRHKNCLVVRYYI